MALPPFLLQRTILQSNLKGHSFICHISHNQRTSLYLYYFMQPKGILVSILVRTTKGPFCIYTASYNHRAFLCLYYFLQQEGILACIRVLTTKGFHIFVFLSLLSDNTLSPFSQANQYFLRSKGRGGKVRGGLRRRVFQMLLRMIICLSRWYISTTIDCTVEWALGLVQLDSIQLMAPLQFSYLWKQNFGQIVWTVVVRDIKMHGVENIELIVCSISWFQLMTYLTRLYTVTVKGDFSQNIRLDLGYLM
jgi:hypothetical protein